MITRLPDYRPPIEQSLRCVCGLRYLVFTGAPIPFNEPAFEAARERTEQMGTRFIDARSTPWPEYYGGPKTYMVTSEYIKHWLKLMAHILQKPDPTPHR